MYLKVLEARSVVVNVGNEYFHMDVAAQGWRRSTHYELKALTRTLVV